MGKAALLRSTVVFPLKIYNFQIPVTCARQNYLSSSESFIEIIWKVGTNYFCCLLQLCLCMRSVCMSMKARGSRSELQVSVSCLMWELGLS